MWIWIAVFIQVPWWRFSWTHRLHWLLSLLCEAFPGQQTTEFLEWKWSSPWARRNTRTVSRLSSPSSEHTFDSVSIVVSYIECTASPRSKGRSLEDPGSRRLICSWNSETANIPTHWTAVFEPEAVIETRKSWMHSEIDSFAELHDDLLFLRQRRKHQPCDTFWTDWTVLTYSSALWAHPGFQTSAWKNCSNALSKRGFGIYCRSSHLDSRGSYRWSRSQEHSNISASSARSQFALMKARASTWAQTIGHPHWTSDDTSWKSSHQNLSSSQDCPWSFEIPESTIWANADSSAIHPLHDFANSCGIGNISAQLFLVVSYISWLWMINDYISVRDINKQTIQWNSCPCCKGSLRRLLRPAFD